MAQAKRTGAWNEPYPPFSYSESQERRRRRCARAHYHAVYTAHRGWSADPGSDSWRAYRLKKAVPLAAAVGIAVHEAATSCVRALTAGESLPSFQALRDAAAASLNERWHNSRTRRADFLMAPARVPVFLEALYGDGPSPSELHRAAETLDRALLCLCQCDTVWAWVRSAAPSDVILMEPFTAMELTDDLGSTICYGAADLIVRPSPIEPWRIVDFKTGAADGVVDQILTYALIARETLQLERSAAYVGVVVSLGEHPDECVAQFSMSDADLVDAEERVRKNLQSARLLIADPGTGAPREMAAFAMTRDTRTCPWCAYRVLCHPDDVSEGAAIKWPTPAAPPVVR